MNKLEEEVVVFQVFFYRFVRVQLIFLFLEIDSEFFDIGNLINLFFQFF